MYFLANAAMSSIVTHDPLVNMTDSYADYLNCSLGGYNSITTPICAFVDFFVVLIGIPGNILVILSVIKFKALRTPSSKFVVGLAVSDFLVCIAMPYYCSFYFDVPYKCQKYPCLIRYFTIMYATIVSVLSLIGVAVDRYLAVVHPLSYNSLMSSHWVDVSIFGIYIYVACLYIPIFWINTWTEQIPECDLAFIMSAGYALYSYALPICATIIVTFCLYGKIFTIAFSQLRKVSSFESKRMYLESRTTITMFLVIGVNFVSLAPNCVVIITRYFDLYDEESLGDAKRLMVCLYLGKSCINPLIYGWKNKVFRDAFKKLLTKNCWENLTKIQR